MKKTNRLSVGFICVVRPKAELLHRCNTKGIRMKTADYLDQLLRKYSGTFDIYQPYVIHGKEYPAYGYFFCI